PANLGDRTVTIMAGDTSATLNVAIDNDDRDEVDGSVTATLAGGGVFYNIDAAADSDRVAVFDNDVPRVRIVAAAPEGDEGEDVVFTITAAPAPAINLTVPVQVMVPAAFAITDALPTSVTLTGAAASVILTVATAEDRLDEDDGLITARLSGGANYILDTALANYTVRDDDTPVLTIAVTSVTVSEGASNAMADYTITADIAPRAPLVVALNVSEQRFPGFVLFADKGNKRVTLDFAAEEPHTAASYSVPVDDDEVAEDDGTITVTLATNAGQDYTIGTAAAATITITDDDTAAPDVFSPPENAALIIGAAGATSATVRGSAAAGATVSISVVGVSGFTPATAIAEADGEWRTGIDISGLDDGNYELSIVAMEPGKKKSATVTRMVVLDKTPPTVVITAAANELQVNGSTQVTFAFSEPPFRFILNQIDVSPGNRGTLSALTGPTMMTVYTATFTARNAAATVTVSVPDGLFIDSALNPSVAASLAITIHTQAVSTPVAFTTPTAGGYVNGGDTLTAITVAGTSGNDADINITITDGANATTSTGTTADDSGDWFTTADVSTLAEGELTITATASEMGKARATATPIRVTKDTVAPQLGITASATTIAVGGTVTIAFAFTEAPLGFAEADISVSGGVLSGLTIDGLLRTATFVAGSSAATATIAVAAGSSDAPGFTDAAGNHNTAASLTLAVTNRPAFSVADAADVNEPVNGMAYMTFPVSLSDAILDASVDYTIEAGTASEGSDYTATDGTLSFSSGDTEMHITVMVLGDDLYEAAESLQVMLGNALGGSSVGVDIGRARATGVINDTDEVNVGIAFTSVGGEAELTLPLEFTVTASGATLTSPLILTYSHIASTATAGIDFIAPSGSIILAAAQSAATISVTVIDDNLYEPNEAVVLTLISAAPMARVTLDATPASGAILDDDIDSAKPTLALVTATDTGVSNSDLVTNEGFPIFALGNLVANATVTVLAEHPNGLSITRKTLVASGAGAMVAFANPGDDDNGMAANCDILAADMSVVRA
ncbi:MAG: Calx-beta domain-containing protein, partial [Pseudohongiellaceae bacterium]